MYRLQQANVHVCISLFFVEGMYPSVCLSLKDALSSNWEMPNSPPFMHTLNWLGAQPLVNFPYTVVGFTVHIRLL